MSYILYLEKYNNNIIMFLYILLLFVIIFFIFNNKDIEGNSEMRRAKQDKNTLKNLCKNKFEPIINFIKIAVAFEENHKWWTKKFKWLTGKKYVKKEIKKCNKKIDKYKKRSKKYRREWDDCKSKAGQPVKDIKLKKKIKREIQEA